jgi:hypothetical protein
MKRNIKLDAWYNLQAWYIIPSVLFSRYQTLDGRVYEIELSFLCVTVLLSSKPKQLKYI